MELWNRHHRGRAAVGVVTPPKLLLVLSEQRSGSTFFSEALASVLPCGIALGESMLPNAGGEGFDQRPFAAALNTRLRYKRASMAYAWLMHVRKHACAERKCECIGVVKLFRTHPVRKLALRHLVTSPDVASVILERNASDVECSLRWARQTSDFATTPNERRRVAGQSQARARFHSNCVPSQDFSEAHGAWYAQLRLLRTTLHVPFDEATQRTAEALQRVAVALHVPASPWVAPRANEMRALPATLGLITIVRRRVDRLAQWLTHHSGIGVNEIALYSTSEVHHAVAQSASSYGAVKLHGRLEAVINTSSGREWSYAWKKAGSCLHVQNTPFVRDAPLRDMCERLMFMPEQAQVVRHAASRLKSTWLLHIDVDEHLSSNGGPPEAWRSYLTMMSARKRIPGGVYVPQLQMVGSLNDTEHLLYRLNRWEENKCLVRRHALHEHPRAFGSVHEVTLKRGEFYVPAPARVLALLHYRYVGWNVGRRAEIDVRMRELGCDRTNQDEQLTLICEHKRKEIARWSTQLVIQPRARLRSQRS